MFEPMSEAFADNPYQFYARLRELDEPYFYEDINVYLLSKYPDVDGAARNPKLVRSQDLFLDQDDVKAQQRARNWHDMPNHENWRIAPMVKEMLDGVRYGTGKDDFGWNIPV